MNRYFDKWTIVVIILTIILFVVALFVKGFTHQLLIEAGVLLVSIKIILMSYQNIRNFEELKNDLTEIKDLLRKK
jgi:protein-S-isoprenylcysteine O-methyltransferase Ste14